MKSNNIGEKKNLRSSPCTLSLQEEEAEPMRFSALQVYSPISVLVALLSFRQATPFEYSSLQVGLERTLPSALNQDTLISGVPATLHFRQTASPAVTSMGSRVSTKYGGSVSRKDSKVTFEELRVKLN